MISGILLGNVRSIRVLWRSVRDSPCLLIILGRCNVVVRCSYTCLSRVTGSLGTSSGGGSQAPGAAVGSPMIAGITCCPSVTRICATFLMASSSCGEGSGRRASGRRAGRAPSRDPSSDTSDSGSDSDPAGSGLLCAV
ncbi:unnamed protein product [Chrysodeixis includens]|uniref:Uncharacterized protein n=1 Tax=Chrysodeixis includens TaxID=689277 RepID=A0A9N8KUX0_CHRIL|nr:unnamed protein product [Chrysodeixis includens]